MVLADSHRISLSPWYSGYFRELIYFRLHGFHILWLAVPGYLTNKLVCNSLPYSKSGWKSHYTYDARIRVFNTSKGLSYFRFARRYLGNHDCFIFLQVLRYFSSLSLLCCTYVFSAEWWDITLTGLPHSEIHGSKVASTCPWRIAGNRVLHRLFVPRHPPYALSNLTKNFYQYR